MGSPEDESGASGAPDSGPPVFAADRIMSLAHVAAHIPPPSRFAADRIMSLEHVAGLHGRTAGDGLARGRVRRLWCARQRATCVRRGRIMSLEHVATHIPPPPRFAADRIMSLEHVAARIPPPPRFATDRIMSLEHVAAHIPHHHDSPRTGSCRSSTSRPTSHHHHDSDLRHSRRGTSDSSLLDTHRDPRGPPAGSLWLVRRAGISVDHGSGQRLAHLMWLSRDFGPQSPAPLIAVGHGDGQEIPTTAAAPVFGLLALPFVMFPIRWFLPPPCGVLPILLSGSVGLSWSDDPRNIRRHPIPQSSVRLQFVMVPALIAGGHCWIVRHHHV